MGEVTITNYKMDHKALSTTQNVSPSPPKSPPNSAGNASGNACETQTPKQVLEAAPYPHQVGGHRPLAVTRGGRVLKPLYEKELRFYHYIHSDQLPTDLRWIRNTTPKFYGQSTFPSSALITAEHQNAVADFADSDDRGRPPVRWRDTAASSTSTISPWAVTMGLRSIEKSKAVSSTSSSTRLQQGESITLEDINRSFLFPCVLDCKIGTRHYDDDATEEKRRRHMLKSANTTSAKHGIRFTGMQSYKRQRANGGIGVLEFRDKYYGRALKEEDLVPETRWFFDNGVRVRTDCIALILEKLQFIRDRVVEQRHFKFYSSSLLLVYEGASPDMSPCRADVRMIDFAHTQWRKDGQGEPDTGYILGIENLIRILRTVAANEHACERSVDATADGFGSGTSTDGTDGETSASRQRTSIEQDCAREIAGAVSNG